MPKAWGIALAVVSALVASSAHGRAQAPSSAPSPPLSPPALTLTVTPATGGGPWKLKIENTGEVPLRVAADPRLLVLDVTAPAGFVDDTASKAKRGGAAPKAEVPKPVRCILPDDARPATDEGRELVIPGKRSWSTTIDPLFYCFGAHERGRLVAGATVTAHFGWPGPLVKPAPRATAKPVPPAPPFVAAPVGAALGHVAPAKELESAAFTLAESSAVASATAAASTSSLSVALPDALDVARGVEVQTTVTIANTGDKPAILLARPETVRFNVAGPGGSVTCGASRSIGSPIRELFSTIGVKGRATVTVLLTAMCPSDTFDEPGIYRVTPVLDTSGASGRSIGLKTWDGVAVGTSSMLMRVRSPRRPSRPPTTRPALD